MGGDQQEARIAMAEAGTDVIVREEGGMRGNGNGSNGTPVADRVVKSVQEMQAWYAAEFERRLAALHEILNAQLQTQIQEVQNASRQPTPTATPAVVMVADASTAEKLLEEIKRTEEVAHKCASEMERMVADDAVNLGLLLQMRNHQIEVKAYLRGLRFSMDGASSATPASPLPNAT